jgi:hypothetical protein
MQDLESELVRPCESNEHGQHTSTALSSSGEYTGWKRTQSPRTIVGTVLVASGLVRAPEGAGAGAVIISLSRHTIACFGFPTLVRFRIHFVSDRIVLRAMRHEVAPRDCEASISDVRPAVSG